MKHVYAILTERFKQAANAVLHIAWAVDWRRSIINLVVTMSNAYAKCYVGTIVALVVCLRVGVLLGTPWAAEMDAAGILRALESLDPETVSEFDQMGRMGVGIALVFGTAVRAVRSMFFDISPVPLDWVRFRNRTRSSS